MKVFQTWPGLISLSLIVILCVSAYTFYKAYGKFGAKQYLLRGIPYPPMNHHLGHLAYMLSPLKHLYRKQVCDSATSPIHQLGVVQNVSVFINSPEECARILLEIQDKGPAYLAYRFDPTIPDLFTADASDHQQRYDAFQSSLCHLDIREERITANLEPLLVRAAESGTPLDISQVCAHLALDITCESAFSYELNAVSNDLFNEKGPGVHAALKTLERCRASRSLYGQHTETESGVNDAKDKGDVSADEEEYAQETYGNFIEILLEVVKTNAATEGTPSLSTRLVDWVNTHLPTANEYMDESTLRDLYLCAEIHQILRHGYQALGATLQWVLVSLHRHPRCRMKLEESIATARVVSPDDNAAVREKSHVATPEYLEAFLKETLRKYPPCGSVVRVPRESVNIQGYIVDKGVPIHCPIYSIQNTCKIWENPNLFLPERWFRNDGDGDDGSDPEKHHRQQPPGCPFQNENSLYSGVGFLPGSLSFLPFSAGSRSCLGKNLALKVIRGVLLVVAMNYRMEPCMDVGGTNTHGTKDSLVTESECKDYFYEEIGGTTESDLLVPLYRRSITVEVTRIRPSDLGCDWKALYQRNIKRLEAHSKWKPSADSEDETDEPSSTLESKWCDKM